MSSFFGFGNSNTNNEQHHHQSTTTTTTSPMKKSQFYVWFLGSKRSEGLRGREFVLPALKELIKENNGDRTMPTPPPSKVTVQLSEKGIKIIQSLPALSRRTGKLKMELMKLIVPAHSVTYSMIAPQPYNDVVACILLLYDPSTRCPVHVHAYRCDSPETASILHSSLQILVDRPQNQRALFDVERRLTAAGLLINKNRYQNINNSKNNYYQETEKQISHQNVHQRENDHHQFRSRNLKETRQQQIFRHQRRSLSSSAGSQLELEGEGEGESSSPPHSYDEPIQKDRYYQHHHHRFDQQQHQTLDRFDQSNQKTDEKENVMNSRRKFDETHRVTRLHEEMFKELKEKLQSKGPLLVPSKDYAYRLINAGVVWPPATAAPSAAFASSKRILGEMFSSSNKKSPINTEFEQNEKFKRAPVNIVIPHARSTSSLSSATKNLDAENGHGPKMAPNDSPVGNRSGATKLRWFGDTLQLKKQQSPKESIIHSKKSDDEQKFPSSIGVGNRSKSEYNVFFSPSADNYSQTRNEGGNWSTKRGPFLSMENLRKDNYNYDNNDNETENARRYSSSSYFHNNNNNNNNSYYSSLPRSAVLVNEQQNRIRRLPKPAVCDPFGRKYEHRTTVTKFWKNVQLPTRVEDNYGLWYLAPSDHCFP